MVPSVSLAMAARPSVAGAWAEVPSAGEVSDTPGAAFTTTVAVAELAVAPALSRATALTA